MTDSRYHFKEVKKAIRKSDLAEFFTISKYGFSPYRACEHGCLYCDGRAEKYYVDGEFDKDIVIRKNIADLLDQEMVKLRERAFLCIGSGVSDAYQPVEQDHGIMRRCAEILVKYDMPVVIITKSSLILRDLDLWAELNRKSRFLLIMSISTTDESVRTLFEPGASPLEQRFETLRQFKMAGCSTGVLAMPLLPHVTETESSMGNLALAVKNAGVDFCMPGGLTLRPGVQKETFLACIRASYPHYVQLYEQIYNQNRQSGAPSHAWHSAVQPYYKKMIETTGLSPVIPHTIFKGLVSRHEELWLVMSLMKVACEYLSIDTKRLQKAMSNYYQWVIEQRRPVNRSRKASYAQIDRTLEGVCDNGSIAAITGNEKLGAFVTSIVKDNAVFDFATLRFK